MVPHTQDGGLVLYTRYIPTMADHRLCLIVNPKWPWTIAWLLETIVVAVMHCKCLLYTIGSCVNECCSYF